MSIENAANEIDKTIAGDKRDKEISDMKDEMKRFMNNLTVMESMLKSTQDQLAKKETGEVEDPPVDFSSIDPEELAEELAKSIPDDADRKDYIVKLCEASGVLPQDMHDEDGEPYIGEEMLKSINESEERGSRILQGILYSLQEMNERRSKMDAVQLQMLSHLNKSLTGIYEHMNMNKSVSSDENAEGEGDKLIEVGEGVAADPLSDQNSSSNGEKKIDLATFERVLRKSFPGSYGNMDDERKFSEYLDEVKRTPDDIEGFIQSISSHDDRAIIQSHLSLEL